MAFTPNSSEGTSAGAGAGIGGSLAAAFGTEEQRSEAVDSAKAFRAAAKAGQLRIDPDAAKAAIKEIARAEKAMRDSRHRADVLAQRPKIGSSPYAQRAAGWYVEGGQSCHDAVLRFAEVLRYTREGYEHAMRTYERIDAGHSQTFDRGL